MCAGGMTKGLNNADPSSHKAENRTQDQALSEVQQDCAHAGSLQDLSQEIAVVYILSLLLVSSVMV